MSSHYFSVSILLLVSGLSRPGHAFGRNQCLKTVNKLLQNGTLSPTSPYFYLDPQSGTQCNGPENLTLTLNGCYAFCGSQQTWYTDIGPRLGVWLIPVLLLVANVELSPVDKRNFRSILHLLGDPIDSLWSLLHKLDVWDRCSRLTAGSAYCKDLCLPCRRAAACVLAGYEEVLGPLIDSDRYLESILSFRRPQWRSIAYKLADGRSNELPRSLFTIFLYIFQLINAFIPELGGAPTSLPGGRIATSLLLSWLVPMVVITSLVGYLPSPGSSYDIMSELQLDQDARSPRDRTYRSDFLMNSSSPLKRIKSGTYLNDLAWSGGIHTYRPWKLRYISPTPNRRLYTLQLVFLASVPLLLGSGAGLVLLWFSPPTGPNCRHVWMIGVTICWCISAFLTSVTYRPAIATGKLHLVSTLFKDACFALPIFLIIFLSAAGLFNFCWCWSGPVTYSQMGRVPLLERVLILNGRSTYPIIVGTTLVLDLAFIIFIMIKWRRGFRLLRWSAKERKQEWDYMRGHDLCDCVYQVSNPRLKTDLPSTAP